MKPLHLILLFMLVLALSSCETPPNYENLQKVFPAVVIVATENATGTGFIVNRDGYVLTCQHVVGNNRTALVLMNSGSDYQCDVAAADSWKDLAIVRLPVNSAGYPFAELGDSSESDALQTGAPVTVLSYPGGSDVHSLTLTTGVLCGFGRSRSVQYLQSSARVYPGSSGGPMLDSSGRVIGIINNRYANVLQGCTTFATAASEATGLLDRLAKGQTGSSGPDYSPAPPKPVCSNVGCKAPDFSLQTTDGRQVTLDSFKGRKLIMVFVSPGCASCQDVLACVQKIYHNWPRSQLEVLAVVRGTAAEAQQFALQSSVSYPAAADLDNKITGLFKPDSLPALYILNSLGEIKVKRYAPFGGCAQELDGLLRMIYP